MKKRIVCLMICLVMIVGLLPTIALAADNDMYNVWVGGTQVTGANKDDVLSDGGSVRFTPAANGNYAKLTLNNANITGAAGNNTDNGTGFQNDNYGIESKINLEVELNGKNTINVKEAQRSCVGISSTVSLKISGQGSVDITAAKADTRNSYGIYTTGSLTITGGTITAKSDWASSYSAGICVLKDLTILGGNIKVSSGYSKSGNSYGISTNQDGSSLFIIKDGTVEADGQTRALHFNPDISDYKSPGAMVNEEQSASGATAWDKTTALGGTHTTYKYVKLSKRVVTTYDLWVGGVQVDEDNMNDVLSDGGSVRFTPAANGKKAKLTLDGADIKGAGGHKEPMGGNFGIESYIELDIELIGENMIEANDAERSSMGIKSRYSLEISGSGSLDVAGAKGENAHSYGIYTDEDLTINSGTIYAYGSEGGAYSGGICVERELKINGGTIRATGTASGQKDSYGIIAEGGFKIKDGVIEATGQTRAFDKKPDLTDYASPAVKVNTENDSDGAAAWDETTELGGYGSTYKYVKIDHVKVNKPIEIPFTIVVEQGGNVPAPKQSFELEIINYNGEIREIPNVFTVKSTVVTNGKGEYEGKLVFEGYEEEDDIYRFLSDGIYVREKNAGAKNWKYDASVWYVYPRRNDVVVWSTDSLALSDEIHFEFYPATLVADGDDEYYQPAEIAVDKMKFTNVYTAQEELPPDTPGPSKSGDPKPSKITPTPSADKPGSTDNTDKPKTGDDGSMALWITLICIACLGIGTVILVDKKRKQSK